MEGTETLGDSVWNINRTGIGFSGISMFHILDCTITSLTSHFLHHFLVYFASFHLKHKQAFMTHTSCMWHCLHV